jgi:hypothetical protein
MGMDEITELPHDPNSPWDDEQKKLAAEYLVLVEDAFEKLPNNGKFYFAHAAAILRQIADELDD